MRILSDMEKRIKLKSAAFASALALSPLLFNASAAGSLQEIAKPYLGTYECEQIFFGSENRTDRFDYVRIELMPEGEMKLLYKEKNGKSCELEATYTYDVEKNILTISAELLGEVRKKSVAVEKGAFDISARYGGKMLLMKFVRK